MNCRASLIAISTSSSHSKSVNTDTPSDLISANRIHQIRCACSSAFFPRKRKEITIRGSRRSYLPFCMCPLPHLWPTMSATGAGYSQAYLVPLRSSHKGGTDGTVVESRHRGILSQKRCLHLLEKIVNHMERGLEADAILNYEAHWQMLLSGLITRTSHALYQTNAQIIDRK